jgi:hypothetical protein
MDRMEHHHSDYRGWKLRTIPDRPCLGHGGRAAPPYDVIMAKGQTEKSLLDELHRQVDAVEDAAGEAPEKPPE